MIKLLLPSMVQASTYDRLSFDKRITWTNLHPTHVVICNDSGVSKKDVKHAIKFWTNFYDDYVDTVVVNSKCNNLDLFESDKIVITKRRNFSEHDYYAVTFFSFNETDFLQEISAARIEINPEYSDNTSLLIHELGHSIGITHNISDNTHIMHEHVVDNTVRTR